MAASTCILAGGMSHEQKVTCLTAAVCSSHAVLGFGKFSACLRDGSCHATGDGRGHRLQTRCCPSSRRRRRFYRHRLRQGPVSGSRYDGSIIAWGVDRYGAVRNQPKGNNFIGIACGMDHCLAMKSDGSIVVWGGCEKNRGNPGKQHWTSFHRNIAEPAHLLGVALT